LLIAPHPTLLRAATLYKYVTPGMTPTLCTAERADAVPA
jgi:hypothetical protein